MTYTLHLTKQKHCPVEEPNLRAALEVARNLGWHVSDVEHEDENRGCWMGFCETCDLPIFETDKYNLDTEGVYWHEECPEGASNEK